MVFTYQFYISLQLNINLNIAQCLRAFVSHAEDRGQIGIDLIVYNFRGRPNYSLMGSFIKKMKS